MKNNLHIANQYMEIFFSGENLDRLRDLLGDNFHFKGPLFEFDSADAYVKSLKDSPPKNFNYKILHRYDAKDSVCFIYAFSKPGISTHMIQRFAFKNQKITDILLIFDTADFK